MKHSEDFPSPYTPFKDKIDLQGEEEVTHRPKTIYERLVFEPVQNQSLELIRTGKVKVMSNSDWLKQLRRLHKRKRFFFNVSAFQLHQMPLK